MKKLFFAFLIIASSNTYCQDNNHSVSEDVIKVSVLSPGISYEKSLRATQTLFVQAMLNTSVSFGTSAAFGNTTTLYLDPAAGIQYRYYYNYKARSSKGKRTEFNSMNYVAPMLQVIFSKRNLSSSYFEETSARPITTIGALWGIQRNYPKRFSLDLNIGIGYSTGKETALDNNSMRIKKQDYMLTFPGQLSIGFWLNKKK